MKRAVEEVFAFLADARNDPRWCPKVLLCEQLVGDGPGPGARYRVVHRPSRLRPALELCSELTAYEPPHRLAWRQKDDDGVFEVTYVLEPRAGATRFTQISEVTWKIARPLRPIADRMVPRHLEGQMRALKRLLG